MTQRFTIISDEHCTAYGRKGHPERPARIAQTIKLLREQTEIRLDWVAPTKAGQNAVLRAHSADLLSRLNQPVDFDGDTPYYEGIAAFAFVSAGGALEALKYARAGNNAFCLLRPPGHHATRTQAMGFCYLNSVAIAVLEALATGVKRIAVFDFDVHHGNGTEDILLHRDGAAFFSVHQHPCYPGTGTRNAGNNCFNYPLLPYTPREDYRRTIKQALGDLQAFNPEMIAVSAGFDGYARDPLAQETLELEDFEWIGRQLRTMDIPVFSVLEGGYSKDLPALVLAYFRGLAG